MSEPIDQIRSAKGQAVRGDQAPAADLQPGALTLYDQEAVFTGNGVITPAQVCARVIELESQRIKDLEPFVGSREAAVFTAKQNLMRNNPGMRAQNPEQPVPQNAQFYTQTGMELKNLLAPFKNNLGALRQIVSDMQVGMGGASAVTGHGVHSRGLALPINEPTPK